MFAPENAASEVEHMATPSPDRVVFETALIEVGEFRCELDHPLFEDSGPIENCCVVFPRSGVAIEHEHARSFVANPNVVTLYNPGDRYRRTAISQAGDRSDWFAVRREHAGRLFPITHAYSSARLYAFQRRLHDAVVRERRIDPLMVEEAVMSLFDQVFRTIDGDPPPRADTWRSRKHRDLVEDAMALLSTEFTRPLTLTDIAGRLDVSVFHLCRLFRRGTGWTLHEYRTQLRLRSSLEGLTTRPEGTVVFTALDAGYSSHSHYGLAFRRAFGQTPSEFLRAPLNCRGGF